MRTHLNSAHRQQCVGVSLGAGSSPSGACATAPWPTAPEAFPEVSRISNNGSFAYFGIDGYTLVRAGTVTLSQRGRGTARIGQWSCSHRRNLPR